MKLHMLATAAVLVLAPAAAFAQASTVGGAATGAVVGGVVGGPVGAVVGAGIGAGVGSAVEPPREVVTYVEGEQIPAETVAVREEIVVGKPVPRTVQLRPVPNHTEFRYAFVNKERVIVDSKGNVVKIIN
ncbi:hypothetical protein ASD45_17825 [Pseudolabrys sp. Root1462]|jgi:hypothetical protein|uniref:DUF1236 domain-containing protein n=1 Tax=Pseudolabrys sp. Root1462 TaxID=1736466 RepID=UPI000702FABE|nr:DUF1236 domain-containing protein [Pseudolabrys sp. Root1462]KQY97861.1 hypothetical protein ASD45_17825 [Pseudolabrys sp. Root1462]